MPTTKPRITVLLEPDTYETVRQLAAVNSVSVSRFIGEIIEGLSEPFGVMLELHRHIDGLADDVRRDLAEGFNFANKLIADAFLDGARPGALAHGAGAGERGDDSPPSSNTGAKT